VGRNLVILGEGYAVFLARRLKRVEGYEIAPNRAAPCLESAESRRYEP
jgi:hypothetical protein